jgi:hypothetical protein
VSLSLRLFLSDLLTTSYLLNRFQNGQNGTNYPLKVIDSFSELDVDEWRRAFNRELAVKPKKEEL